MKEKTEKVKETLQLLQLLEVPACGGVATMVMSIFWLRGLVCNTCTTSPASVFWAFVAIAMFTIILPAMVESRVESQLHLGPRDYYEGASMISLKAILVLLPIVVAIGLTFSSCAIWIVYALAVVFDVFYILYMAITLWLLCFLCE